MKSSAGGAGPVIGMLLSRKTPTSAPRGADNPEMEPFPPVRAGNRVPKSKSPSGLVLNPVTMAGHEEEAPKLTHPVVSALNI